MPHNATSRNPRIAAKGHTDLRANSHASPDTRRFATIFPSEVPEAVDSIDTTREEQNDSDDLSRFEFISALDENVSATQVVSVPSSTLSAAQHVIADYRAVRGSDDRPERGLTEKELPQIPDDQRSMYTLATPTDTQSTMDMMWKPKPKVHMRRADQLALMQAQSQAVSMMNDAGLKPTNKIQCRRRGCANILANVEALKYHLHIHNIADLASQYRGTSAPPAFGPSVVESSTSKPRGLKRNHSRSQSSHGTRNKPPTIYTFPRNLSASALPPSLFSPRETTPEASQVPSFTTVAKAFTPDSSPDKPTVRLPVCADEMPSTHTSILSRGRRVRKENMAISVGAERIPSITTLLSPPSSPVGRLTHAPHAKLSVPAAFGVGNNKRIRLPSSDESAQVSDRAAGSRSPMRALSPTRAMSPIRDGIKRILTIGNATDQ